MYIFYFEYGRDSQNKWRGIYSYRFCKVLHGRFSEKKRKSLSLICVAYGGTCFPRDNRAFAALANSVFANALLAEATDQLNNYQTERLLKICEQIADIHLVKAQSTKLKVGMLGLSYKSDTSVVECSAACAIADKLVKKFDVLAYDPLLMPLASQICDSRVNFVSSLNALLYEHSVDILVVATASNNWKNITFNLIDNKALYIVGCRQLLDKEEIEKANRSIHFILLAVVSKLKVEFSYSTIVRKRSKKAVHYQCFPENVGQKVCEGGEFKSEVHFN